MRWSAVRIETSMNFPPENGLHLHQPESQIDREDTGKHL